MKLALSLKNKWRAALVFSAVIVVMLAISLLGKKNVNDLRDTFHSVYEDRLVVEQYIFRISTLLYENRLTLKTLKEGENTGFADVIGNNREIQLLVEKYGKTLLTEQEEIEFNRLKSEFNQISELENKLLYTNGKFNRTSVLNDLRIHFENANSILEKLSTIQLTTGKEMRDDSNKLAASHVIMSRLEIAILIIFALFVQVVIFSARLSSHSRNVNYDLN